MIDKIYTIGYTKKTAETFFELLKKNNIAIVTDIRLNNTSQLAGFTKHPDIKYFLHEIAGISYNHDITFAPEKNTLLRYKKQEIDWDQYVEEFSNTMNERNITNYIKQNYKLNKKICLLCSEATATNCHRNLVADEFKKANTIKWWHKYFINNVILLESFSL
jgi:uncharacterized protein (DUF488 family)